MKQQKKVSDQLLLCGIGDLWQFWIVWNWSWMISRITWTHMQSVWNHSGPSEVPYVFRKQVTGQELFSCFLQQTGSSKYYDYGGSQILLIWMLKFLVPEVIKIKELKNGLKVAELFHGPTLAFKDLALGVVGGLYNYFLERSKKKCIVIVGKQHEAGLQLNYELRRFKHSADFLAHSSHIIESAAISVS